MEKNYREAFGQRLEQERVHCSLSQAGLGEAVGTDSLTVSRWEQGKNFPNPGSRKQLCEFLKKTPEELFPEYLAYLKKKRGPGNQEESEGPEKKRGPGSQKESEGPWTDESEFSSVFYFNTRLPGAAELYGRREMRAVLFNRTRQGASTSLVGRRRIGKTWLLHYLKFIVPEKLGAGYHVGYLDATEASCRSLNGLVKSILEVLEIAQEEYAGRDDPLIKLERAIKKSQGSGTYVLCIDEFEWIRSMADFDRALLEQLRALANNAYLCIVTASRRPLRDILEGVLEPTSPFFNVFEERKLGPFEREEAEVFVAEKGRQAGFLAEDHDYLLKYAQVDEDVEDKEAWYPLCLQLVGQRIEMDRHLGRYRPLDPLYWEKFKRDLGHGC